MDKLKVSIIIPVYNGDNFVEEAIKCALSQTYSNIEVIVVNDGSTDEGKTRDVCSKYFDKISYYEKENGGCASALNFGIEKSTGDAISWLSHDDLYSSDKIEKQVCEYEKLNSNNDLYIIACWSDNITKDGKVLKRKVRKFAKKFTSREALQYMIRGNVFNGLSLLIPKSVLTKFDTKYTYILDWENWIRIAHSGISFFLMQDTLVFNRKHSNQVSQKQKDLYLKETKRLGLDLFEMFLEEKDLEMCEQICYLLSKLNIFDKDIKLYCCKNGIKYSKVKSAFLNIKSKIINFARKVLRK